ncbi:hypothetical protein ANO14919_038230 [Xylariales sp. No.14919]|nr:hypothetical protein ANO14919_038230 [Xylariales sp. No.14919]
MTIDLQIDPRMSHIEEIPIHNTLSVILAGADKAVSAMAVVHAMTHLKFAAARNVGFQISLPEFLAL